MLLRALAVCLLLTGCTHAAPTAPLAAAQAWQPNCHPWTGPCPLPSPTPGPWSALAAPNVVTKATIEGVDQPLLQQFTITLEGSTSLKLLYFWKHWAGMGFTSGSVGGVALDAHNAGVSADRLAAAKLQPGVDAKIVQRAIALLRALAGA